MKVAIINTTEKTGSIGKIADGLLRKLTEDGHEVRIFFRDGEEDAANGRHRIVSRGGFYIHAGLALLTGLHGYYSTAATERLIRQLDHFHPDVVQLYNLHGYYLNINMLLNHLKAKGYATVYSMLDEFPYLGRCCYAYDCEQFRTGCLRCRCRRQEYPFTLFFRRAAKYYAEKKALYEGFEKLCLVGPGWVVERAKSSGITGKCDIRCVDEFIDTENLFFPRMKINHISEEISASEKTVILTVAPYSNPRKGGLFFVELAKKCLGTERLHFVYVGMDVKSVRLPGNVTAIPFVKDQNELAEYYSAADLFVCTSLADTMPNVCLDALACGTPVLGFDVSGTPYTAEPPMGIFVNEKDVEAMYNIVVNVTKKTDEMSMRCREYAVRRYSPDVYYKAMMEIYTDILTKTASQ